MPTNISSAESVVEMYMSCEHVQRGSRLLCVPCVCLFHCPASAVTHHLNLTFVPMQAVDTLITQYTQGLERTARAALDVRALSAAAAAAGHSHGGGGGLMGAPGGGMGARSGGAGGWQVGHGVGR